MTVFLAADNQGGSNFTLFIMMGLIFAAMYFLMIRPQQRRRREMESMQSSISPGDEILTIGGLYGTVVDIDDESVTLEVAPGITNRYARGAISKVVTSTASQDEETETVADEVVERD